MLRMRSYLTRLQLNLGVRRHPTNLVMKALFYGCAAVLRLTRFRGRLTRPKFGAEVAHEIQQEGRRAGAA
jgi:hypothetical protein